MHVLLVDYEYPPLGGGGAILTQTLARELCPRVCVTVLTSGAAAAPAVTDEDGVRVVRVPVAGRRERQKASMLSLLSFVPSARTRGFDLLDKPDVVHTFFAIPSGPAGRAAAKRFGVPHVLTLIGADVHDPSRRFSPDRFAPLGFLVSRVTRSAEAVTAISRDIAERGLALTGRGDITVVPCGIADRSLPPPSRQELGWPDDEVVIVTTARLVARKAIDRLIRAVTRIPGSVRLEVIGDGPERASLEALAGQTGARVTFAGEVDDHGRDLRLASADVFCQPSLHEGFGIAILEAMSCGVPVVATNSGGPRDFVVDGVNGFLVEDDDELLRRLSELAADAAARARIGAAARL